MTNEGPADTPSPRLLHQRAWADAYELIDLQLSPLGLRAIEALEPCPGDVVLDVGCGAGQTLLQLAGRVGPEGQVIGVDVAPLLLAIARQRTEALAQVRLVEADAQTLDLPTASVNAVFSRFGVMSFHDPVAAFTNLRRVLRPSGVLAFVCWRSLQGNELDHLPLAAAGLPLTDEAPFSFADPDNVRRVLGEAGFSEIDVRSHDERVSSGDLEAMTSALLKVGPLGKAVCDNPALRATAEPRLREALGALGDPSSVQLEAAVWVVTACAGATTP